MRASRGMLILIGIVLPHFADAASIRGSIAVDQVPTAPERPTRESARQFAESESLVPGVAWMELGLGICIGALVAGVVAAMMMYFRKPEEKPAEPDSTVVQQEDCAAMLKTLAQKVAQDVGPKLSKGGAVRNVLQKRMSTFTDNAKKFLLNEMNGAAGDVLKEMDAEEAMLLLDWNHAVEANFPPISILIAGVLSPTTLQLMAAHHSTQAFTVGLPMFCLCVAAIYIDWGAVCSIPTIFAWLYTQTVLAACMFFGHFLLCHKVRSGQGVLTEKSDEVQKRIRNTEAGSMSNMREQVVGNFVLLQEALLVENGVRSSLWNIIVGVSTVAWLFTTIWNLVLIIGWTFVPGVTAFHPKAAEVAGGDFCGAWMTVLVLRISMLLSVLYFFLNVATVIQFACDMMIESPSFAEAVLDKARSIDKNGVGLPVVELLAKAFLLRGGSDTLNSKLAIVSHHRKSLEKEEAALREKLKELRARLASTKDHEKELESQCSKDGGDLAAQCNKLSDDFDFEKDFESWKAQGQEATAKAEAKAKEIQAATTEELERLYEKICQVAEMVEETVENSVYFQAMEEKYHELKDELSDPEFQKKLMDKLTNLKDMAIEATQKAEGLANDALKMATDPENLEKLRCLQDVANQAMQRAKAAANQLADAAHDPELRQRLQEEAQKAFEKAREAAHEAADAVTNPELQQQLREASMDVLNKVEDSALTAVAAVKAAAEDPELQEKFKSAVSDISKAAVYIENTNYFKAMEERYNELKDKLTNPEFKQQLMMQVTNLRSGANAAAEKAKGLASAAMEAAQDPENLRKLQDAANQAMEEAKAAGHELSNAAQNPEMQQKLQEEAQKAFVKAREAAHQLSDAVQDPALQQQLRDTTLDALNKTEDAVLTAAAGVRAAAQDPELQEKLKKAVSKTA